ncbi:PREDICTED: LOW QUALITY PROTEIN: R3H and coiled-coil domain-containing protein 1 [Aptenodytes forsteri]|uniref:LOW QUALITY PROTEIN: R3H and coiled-coil domain-containing protein 1 n=1 Tax=Aptenodytes forsteri TaxID=9233 RepID=UPI0004F3FB65|nr:PREDICTED: LOW QUALITY PROTEIN: R3H and coiled-coil domain-containing protein 1 [Aptenodytes forsteri]
MDGVFLSPNEDEFVGRIAEELEHFMLQGQHHRVLLFPPLSSRLRYLIHRTVDNVDLLSSFSVGEGWRRRTVICHSAVRLPSETSDQKPSSNPPRPQRPPQPWGRGARGGRLRHSGEVHSDNSRACVGSGRIKRPPRKKPDKALYVPKAMRKKAEWGEQESPVAAGTESGGDMAQEEEICPKASVGDAQEELGKSEGSPGGVSLALGKQQEPGEECVSGKSNDDTNDERPPCCTDVPSLENSNDFSGQESQDKDCSDSLSSVHNKNPIEAEEQDQSCDNTIIPEGSKILCQLQAEDQNSQDAGVAECGKNSSLSGSRSSNCCTDPAAAESSAMSLVLENQDKSCAAAKSLESGGNVSPPEEQGKDFVNAGTGEGGKSFSELESQDQECPSVPQVGRNQNPPEAQNEPLATPEPVHGADPSAPAEQNERWVDAPVQNRSGKVSVAEEEDKERSGLAEALWRELHLSASNDFSGQESQDKDCSDSLSSVHNKNPIEAEEQDQSCDNTIIPEGSKILCQLQAEDQNSQDAGVAECGKNSSLSGSRSSNCCTDPAAAESSAMSLVLENQDKSCAAAKSLESGGNVSPPEEQGKDFVNAGTGEGGKSFSELESQDQECPSVPQVGRNQNPPEAQNEPLATPEPVHGADPSAPAEQNERWVDAPVQNRSGKVSVAEEEDKERSGLAEALWRELHLSAGDKEESAAIRGQSSLEDDCTAELFAEIVGYLTVKDVSIEKISFDYSSYGDAQLGEGDFGHVTEIYDFSPSLKTEHLLEAFSDFHESGFKIQWVDDTHALGIFSSLSTASQALGRRYPSLKIRPLIHATKQSKIKALQRPKLLHLAKERPQTDTAVAKRLVTRALGLKHKQQGISGTEALLPESLDQEE